MKNIYIILFILLALVACKKNTETLSNDDSASSNAKQCDDMVSYNKGINVGSVNKNYWPDCDYFWNLEKNEKLSKTCYCKGYNSVENLFVPF